MKRAMMRDADMEQIKKFETDYFSENYGQYYQNMREIDIKPLILK